MWPWWVMIPMVNKKKAEVVNIEWSHYLMLYGGARGSGYPQCQKGVIKQYNNYAFCHKRTKTQPPWKDCLKWKLNNGHKLSPFKAGKKLHLPLIWPIYSRPQNAGPGIFLYPCLVPAGCWINGWEDGFSPFGWRRPSTPGGMCRDQFPMKHQIFPLYHLILLWVECSQATCLTINLVDHCCEKGCALAEKIFGPQYQ